MVVKKDVMVILSFKAQTTNKFTEEKGLKNSDEMIFIKNLCIKKIKLQCYKVIKSRDRLAQWKSICFVKFSLQGTRVQTSPYARIFYVEIINFH